MSALKIHPSSGVPSGTEASLCPCCTQAVFLGLIPPTWNFSSVLTVCSGVAPALLSLQGWFRGCGVCSALPTCPGGCCFPTATQAEIKAPSELPAGSKQEIFAIESLQMAKIELWQGGLGQHKESEEVFDP